ncbi:MAG: hypothetical protein RIC36_11310 [Rhodospirillales bacterium]
MLTSAAAQAETPLQKVQVQATRALFEAIQKNSITAVRTQIALGADLEARNADGQTPVGLAVALRYTTIAELLNRSRVMQRAADESAAPLRAPTVKVLRAGQSRTGNAPPVRDSKVVTDENGVAIYESARDEAISKPASPTTAFPSTLVWPPAPDFVTSVDGSRVPTDPSANAFSFDSPPDRVTAAPVSSVTAEPVAPVPAPAASPAPAVEPVQPATAKTEPATIPDSKTPATAADPVTALQEKAVTSPPEPAPKQEAEPSIMERIGKLFSDNTVTDKPQLQDLTTVDTAPEPPAISAVEPVDATTGLDPEQLAKSLAEPVQATPVQAANTEFPVAEAASAAPQAEVPATPVHASPADFVAALGRLLAPTSPAGPQAEPVVTDIVAEQPLAAAVPEAKIATPLEVLDRPLPMTRIATAPSAPDTPQVFLAETAPASADQGQPAAEQRTDLLDVIGRLFETEPPKPADPLVAEPETVASAGETAVDAIAPSFVTEPVVAKEPVVTTTEIPEPDFFNRVASLFSFGTGSEKAEDQALAPETVVTTAPDEPEIRNEIATAAARQIAGNPAPAPGTAYLPGEKKIVAGAWPPAPTEPTAPPPPMPVQRRSLADKTAPEEVVQTASLETGPAPSRVLPLPGWTMAPAVEPRTFAFSELMHLGHRRDLENPEDAKCLKHVYRHKKERIRACVVDVKWPREIRPDFVSNSIIYNGQKAVVVYQDGIAAAMYALFRSDAYERISTYLASQYGPTSDYNRDQVQLMAGGRRENQISLWRGTDPASGLEMEMEVRKFDDIRDLFGDPYHGMIEIRFADSRRVFQFVQPLDLMTNR